MTWPQSSRLTGAALSAWRCLTRERKKKGLEGWRPSILFGINFLREVREAALSWGEQGEGTLKEPPQNLLVEAVSLRLRRTQKNLPE